jgi:hypothetical protein
MPGDRLQPRNNLAALLQNETGTPCKRSVSNLKSKSYPKLEVTDKERLGLVSFLPQTDSLPSPTMDFIVLC